MLKNWLLALCVLCLACQVSFASEGDLHKMGRDMPVIKVFIGDISNKSGHDPINASDFKNSLEEAIKNRKSVNFEIVKSLDISNIQITAIIKKYQYLKDDPITTYGTSWGFVLDAATSENYTELQVEFTVADSKSGNILWKQDVTTFAKKMMSPEESIPLIYEKTSRTFLSKCFGKGR